MAQKPNTGGTPAKKTNKKKGRVVGRVNAPNVGTGTGTLSSVVAPVGSVAGGLSSVQFDTPADRTARARTSPSYASGATPAPSAAAGALSRVTTKRVGLPASMQLPAGQATTLPQIGGNPLAQLKDPLALNADVQNAADLVYGSDISARNRQIDQSPQRQANISGWFKQYLDTLKSTQARQDAIFQEASNPMNHEIPTEGMSAEAQAALANRNALGDSFTGMIRSERGNAAEQAKTEFDAGGQSELGYHLAEDRDTGALRSQLQDVLKERGNYASTYRTQRIGEERQYGLQLRDAKRADNQAQTEKDSLAVALGSQAAKTAQSDADFFAKNGVTRQEYEAAASNPKKLKAITQRMSRYQNTKAGRNPDGSPKVTPTLEQKAKVKYLNEHGYWPPSGAPKGESGASIKAKAEADFLAKHGYLPRRGKATPAAGKKTDQFGNTQKDVRKNLNGFNTARLYLRDNPKYIRDPHNLAAAINIATGQRIDNDILTAVTYWAQHGAHLSPRFQKQLRRIGLTPELLQENGYRGLDG